MDTQELQKLKNKYDIVGNDDALGRALETAVAVAPTDLTVLITGESGVGKEVIPQIIHQNSRRRTGKYLAVNCGAIPEGTINAELFGHEKGAFTSAETEHAGYFEVADKGTIFLDEVADLTLDAQARLLRVLETGEYMRVGSSRVRKTDVRVVAATNKDLMQMVKRGEFREDLFYRIAAIRIEVPPLRERGEDIKLLATKFSYDYGEEHSCPPLMFDESAYRELMAFRWSGNVRELQSLVREMSSFESGMVNGSTVKRYLSQKNHSSSLPVIFDTAQHDYTQERELIFKLILQMQQEIKDLKKAIDMGANSGHTGNNIHLSSAISELQRQSTALAQADSLADVDIPDSEWQEVSDHYTDIDTHKSHATTSAQRSSFSDIKANAVDVEEDKIKTLQDTEREVIINAIERNKGRRKQTAEELGISERTLYRKIKEYGLEYRNNRK